MAHTQQGSFIVPIYLPLSDVAEPEQPTLELEAPPEPQERRVMRTLAESLAAFSRVVVDPESEPKGKDILGLVTSGVSTEFATALHNVISQQAVAEFSASFAWAPAGGPPPAVPAQTTIPAAVAPRVERVARRLRETMPRRSTELLTGPIVEVHRNDDESGSVVIQTIRNAHQALVRVNVSPQRLDEALVWMRRRETVLIRGRVRRISSGLACDKRDAIHLLRATQLLTSEIGQ
jgi:hypothetical protein